MNSKTARIAIERDLMSAKDELGDWHATFPGRTAEQVCREWGATQKSLDSWIKAAGDTATERNKAREERDQLKGRLDVAEVDRFELGQWLRNAERILYELGYSRCNIPACNCNSYHKNLDQP